MNIYNIPQGLKFLNQVGMTLNVDERIKLDLTLSKLADKTKFDQVLFWGKIEGMTKDYYIAEALKFENQYEFPEKLFFWV